MTIANISSVEPEPSPDDDAPETPRARFARRFFRHKGAVVALGYIVVLIIVAFIGQWITPADPDAQNLRNTLADPIASGLMGTDKFGRDSFSRLIVATHVALLAVGEALAIALALGIVPGLIAGYFGRRVDALIMRITDAVMSFPPLIFALALIVVLGPGLNNAMLAIGVIFAPTFIRLVRGCVLAIRGETFIEASRSIGTPDYWIVSKHIFPNILPPLLVQISMMSASAVIAEAGLSFLGLGVQPPQASWGSMLSTGYRDMERQPWLVVFPGLAIGLTVLAFNVLGDGIRDSIGREVRTE